jgi:thiamine kinase-like enzyme
VIEPASRLLPEPALALVIDTLGDAARGAPAELIPAVTNHVVRLQMPGASYAVRVPGTATGALEIDRRSECAAFEAAARADLAPHVMVCDPDSGILITRWIEAETWIASRAREPDAIRLLAEALRKLHALAIPTAMRSLAPLPLLEGYWRLVAQRAPSWRLRLAPLHARVMAIAQRSHVAPYVLCHSDLHHRNLIESDRLRLLDWEYAGVTEAAYDLASFSQSNDLTDADKRLLLDAYGGPPALGARFRLHCALFDWICVLWLAVVDAAEGTVERARLEMLAQRALESLDAD